MTISRSGPSRRGPVVVSPRGQLVTGGPAEDFDRQVQRLFREGHRHVAVDLQSVETVDTAGVGALARAEARARRLGGMLRITGASPPLRAAVLQACPHLPLDTFQGFERAFTKDVPWRHVGLAAAAVAVCGSLVALGVLWPSGGVPPLTSGITGEAPRVPGPATLARAATELVELIAAGLIGFLVTAVQRRLGRDRTMTRSMEQAQVLLCVSGAMMMIIIGDSLARAFGIAGAAGIVRFRTPVEDPKDVTVLFLLMGLGMACGMGALTVAGLGALFLCAGLVVLDRTVDARPRAMAVEITAADRVFPLAHVAGVLAQHGVAFEPRKVAHGDQAIVTYQASLPAGVCIEDVTAALVGDGTAGVKHVTWQPAKKE